jgi:hypothetical protein
MKKLVFLVQTEINDEKFNPGETKKFTTVWKKTNSKNSYFLMENLVELLVSNGSAVIDNPDSHFEERGAAVSAFYNGLETRNSQYARGLISDTELLLSIIQNATDSLIALNGVDSKVIFDRDQMEMQVEQAVRAFKLKGGK